MFAQRTSRNTSRAVSVAVRTLLALGIISMWSLPHLNQAQAGHTSGEKLYVGQQGLDSVAVFDADAITSSSTPLTTISLGAGAEPEELIADNQRPYLYVSDSALKGIHIINTTSDTLEYFVPLSATPQGLVLDASGRNLYVATATSLVKVDTRSRMTVKTSATLSPSFTPWDVALSKNEDRLWVTSHALSGEVRGFDPSTLVQTDSTTPGGSASGYGIAADGSDTNRAFYADGLASVMRTFDDQTNTSGTLSTVTGYALGPWAVEREPRSPNRYLVTDGFTAGPAMGDRLIEFNSLSPFGEIRSLTGLGGNDSVDQPSEIAFSSSVDRAFVTLTATDKVSVINLNPSGSMSEVAVVPLTAGADPYGIEIASAPKSLLRFAGANRYDTGAKVSQETYGDMSADALVVASLEVFPDSLVSSPLSGLLRGPLLGTRKDSLPSETAAEIARVFDDVSDAETDVYVVGGTAVISDTVVNAIKAINPKITVERLAGANRYETSKIVAGKMDSIRGSRAGSAFVAKGSDFPDALTAGAVAANATFSLGFMPIVLTESDTLNSHAQDYLSGGAALGTLYLAGGTSALSSQIATQVASYAGSVTRLGGTNRYDTARIIAGYFFPAGPGGAIFALGTQFPDALVAAPFAGISSLSGSTPTLSMPILLVSGSSVPSETMGYISSVGTLTRGYVSGGTAAIESSVESTLNGLY